MAPSGEIKSRINQLEGELNAQIKHSRRRAQQNHWIALLLMLTMIVSSIISGIGGIASLFQVRIVGGLALLPAAIAIFATTFKFQQRSYWHFRRLNEWQTLKSRLTLQLPETPTADNIAAIAKDRDLAQVQAQSEWEKQFTLNFASFLPREARGQ